VTPKHFRKRLRIQHPLSPGFDLFSRGIVKACAGFFRQGPKALAELPFKKCNPSFEPSLLQVPFHADAFDRGDVGHLSVPLQLIDVLPELPLQIGRHL
jgi:hypothetical protein